MYDEPTAWLLEWKMLHAIVQCNKKIKNTLTKWYTMSYGSFQHLLAMSGFGVKVSGFGFKGKFLKSTLSQCNNLGYINQ